MYIFTRFFIILSRFFRRKKLASIQPLTVGFINDTCHLLAYDTDHGELLLIPGTETNDFNIKKSVRISLFDQKKNREPITDCHGFSLWQESEKYFISYTRKKNNKNYVMVAESTSADRFYGIRQHAIDGQFVSVTHSTTDPEKFVYYAEKDSHISVYTTRTKRSIVLQDNNVIAPRERHFDEDSILIIATESVQDGSLLLYDATRDDTLQIGAALFAGHSSSYLIWQTDDPIYIQEVPEMEYGTVTPLGMCRENYGFRIFYTSSKKGLFSVFVDDPLLKKHNKTRATLEKSAINPIMEPNDNHWESESAFNPAIYDDGEKTHMLYRAIGGDGVSRLGYASSENGHYFDVRDSEPALQIASPRSRGGVYDPVMYPSGGSWGGIEDPRMVEIDGMIYVTASIFDGWDFIRMASFSIKKEDFVTKCFNWNDPVYLSPPGVISKNWVVFPEKINGKFAVFHGLTQGGRDRANIDYLDSLEEENFIDSDDTFRHEINDHEWDSMIRGAGPPPLKTKYGWLLFYHAVDSREPNRYKLGAMLLDSKDPSKILHRSKYPILQPDEFYENNGKPGVVYATGATITGDLVNIYYGGADAVVCCASIRLETLIDSLTKGHEYQPINTVYLY